MIKNINMKERDVKASERILKHVDEWLSSDRYHLIVELLKLVDEKQLTLIADRIEEDQKRYKQTAEWQKQYGKQQSSLTDS